MVFSDETSLCVEGRGFQYVRRGSGERLRTCHLSQRSKFPQKVMFWGCFCATGLGSLHECKGSVNTIAYISLLQSQLMPQISNWFSNSTSWTFVQDNAPCHKSKTTMTWLAQHGVVVMDWPPNSPDLNPIENIWGVLKQRLMCLGSLSKTQLIDNVQKIWREDPTLFSMCTTLVQSMHQRVSDVLKNHGGVIDY